MPAKTAGRRGKRDSAGWLARPPSKPGPGRLPLIAPPARIRAQGRFTDCDERLSVRAVSQGVKPCRLFPALLLFGCFASAQTADLVSVLERLGHRSFTVREDAQRALASRLEAEPSLQGLLTERLAQEEDAEIALRIRRLLLRVPSRVVRLDQESIARGDWRWRAEGQPDYEFVDDRTVRIRTMRDMRWWGHFVLPLPTNGVRRIEVEFDINVERQRDDGPRSGVAFCHDRRGSRARIDFWERSVSGRKLAMHKDFRHVRVVIQGGDCHAEINGDPRFAVPLRYRPNDLDPGSHRIVIGDTTERTSGTALWRNVAVRIYD